MSKKKTRTLALKVGHPTAFRRTIKFWAKSKDGSRVLDPSRPPVQMVFEPGQDYEISEEEIEAGLQGLIDGGLLVDPNRDPKGRQRRPPAPEAAQFDKVVAKLEKRIEELSAENEDLKKQLASK